MRDVWRFLIIHYCWHRNGLWGVNSIRAGDSSPTNWCLFKGAAFYKIWFTLIIVFFTSIGLLIIEEHFMLDLLPFFLLVTFACLSACAVFRSLSVPWSAVKTSTPGPRCTLPHCWQWLCTASWSTTPTLWEHCCWSWWRNTSTARTPSSCCAGEWNCPCQVQSPEVRWCYVVSLQLHNSDAFDNGSVGLVGAHFSFMH